MPSQFLAARQGCCAAAREATWLQFIEQFKNLCGDGGFLKEDTPSYHHLIIHLGFSFINRP